MMKNTAVLVLAMLAAAGSGSVAEAQDASASALARARASMSPAAAAQFDATLRAALQRGLPTQPLAEKALEGAAKGVPGERIVVAVKVLADRMGHAQGLLAARANSSDLSAVADALQRGVPDDAIRRIGREAAPGEAVGVSVHALADLLDRGVPVAVGLDVIGAWRGRGADPKSLREIPAAVERLVRQGVGPASAGAAIAAGVKLGRGPGSIGAADVGALIGVGKGKGKGKT